MNRIADYIYENPQKWIEKFGIIPFGLVADITTFRHIVITIFLLLAEFTSVFT